MHLQLDDASSSMNSGGNSDNDWNISCCLEGSCCQWAGFQADYMQFPVDWSYVQNTFWSDMESSSYAPLLQDQVHSIDWLQYGSDPESEVEFIARNPTVEPFSVTKMMLSENTPAETPNGSWRKTSWPDFEEFTRRVCGDREHSSHSRSSIPRPFPRRQFKCTVTRCSSRFRYLKGLRRHLASHLDERPYVCWVPECQRPFTRGDNLKAHYATHGRLGGRNRYVATLDRTSSVYNPCFRGRLTSDGWPVTEEIGGLSDLYIRTGLNGAVITIEKRKGGKAVETTRSIRDAYSTSLGPTLFVPNHLTIAMTLAKADRLSLR